MFAGISRQQVHQLGLSQSTAVACCFAPLYQPPHFRTLLHRTRREGNGNKQVIQSILRRKVASDCCPLSSVELTQPFGESARLKLSSSIEEPWPLRLLSNNLNYQRNGKWLNCVIDESRSENSDFGGDQGMDLSLYRNVFSAKKSGIEGPCTRADHCHRCTERRQHN